MLRDLKILAAGGRPARLFDMVIELVESVDAHKKHIQQLELQYIRHYRDLIDNFYAALEYHDDEALRYALKGALVDLNDHVARLEEHAR